MSSLTKPGIRLHKIRTKFKRCLRTGFFISTARGLKRYIYKKLGLLQIHWLFISPSHQCNANCVHCYEKFDKKNSQNYLSTDSVKNIIDQFIRLNGTHLVFCSGEFVMRPDAIELIKYAHSKHLSVGLTSNGILLDEHMIDKLISAGLTDLRISIDNPDPESHDSFRRVKGCFQKATDALKIAQKKGLITVIWTYINKFNKNDLNKLLELGKELKINEIFVFFPILSGHFFNKPEVNFTFEEREAIRKKYNNKYPLRLEFPSENEYCRGGGYEHINIMPSGDVTFCPPVPYSYGNIKEKPLKECLIAIRKDYKRLEHCVKGQCPVNFPEYREKCSAKFLY